MNGPALTFLAWELVEKGAEAASEAQDNVLLSAARPKALGAGCAMNRFAPRTFSGGYEVRGDDDRRHAALGRRELHQLPCGAIAKQPGNQCRMHRMAGALGNHPAENAMSGEGQIADEVEDLVADEFIAAAQRCV